MVKLVLLDRDGVLNHDRPDSVTHLSELIVFPEAAQAVALLNQAGYSVAIVTNQSAIGKGQLTEEGLEAIHTKLCDTIREGGGAIDHIWHCPDHPDHPTIMRKPAPGMLQAALDHYGVPAPETPMIGDALRDMEAALSAGCPRYLVRTGKGASVIAKGIPEHLQPVVICENILDAARRIVEAA